MQQYPLPPFPRNEYTNRQKDKRPVYTPREFFGNQRSSVTGFPGHFHTKLDPGYNSVLTFRCGRHYLRGRNLADIDRTSKKRFVARGDSRRSSWKRRGRGRGLLRV